MDAWSRDIVTSILGDDDLDWEHEGYYPTKRAAIESLSSECEACKPNATQRQHTCGLKSMQDLLPKW